MSDQSPYRAETLNEAEKLKERLAVRRVELVNKIVEEAIKLIEKRVNEWQWYACLTREMPPKNIAETVAIELTKRGFTIYLLQCRTARDSHQLWLGIALQANCNKQWFDGPEDFGYDIEVPSIGFLKPPPPPSWWKRLWTKEKACTTTKL